jgi:hypothetical protein
MVMTFDGGRAGANSNNCKKHSFPAFLVSCLDECLRTPTVRGSRFN